MCVSEGGSSCLQPVNLFSGATEWGGCVSPPKSCLPDTYRKCAVQTPAAKCQRWEMQTRLFRSRRPVAVVGPRVPYRWGGRTQNADDGHLAASMPARRIHAADIARRHAEAPCVVCGARLAQKTCSCCKSVSPTGWFWILVSMTPDSRSGPPQSAEYL